MQTEPTSDISKNSKYYLYIAVAFVAILMISNTVAVKLIGLGPLVFTGAFLIFPISYIFGDILTEVYGYKATRRIIWAGFFSQILMIFCYWLVQVMPSASVWPNQLAYESILGIVPRIVVASMIAYFCGEFVNSYVLSKMKIFTAGKHLWARTIGSTVVGQLVDSALFTTLAFIATVPTSILFVMIAVQYFGKVLYEAILTPVTYYIVRKLKQAEGIDVYDNGIDYNPFKLKE
ncbi:MAG TPA: queuosine precursor transporter [Candidatus Paceibacterota bacterium]|nr:queuosine precursor transporter [Candidatus Paceibacterota bacterium]HRZ34398.1 queuosine precursor transporter [Candidatus Paceibacterota bacterium]